MCLLKGVGVGEGVGWGLWCGVGTVVWAVPDKRMLGGG